MLACHLDQFLQTAIKLLNYSDGKEAVFVKIGGNSLRVMVWIELKADIEGVNELNV